MDSSCSIYLFLFRMDIAEVYVIYTLGRLVWFVLYYVTNLGFGFVNF